MIYFIQCGENGPIKIGQSDNPEDRMAQLQTACPYELKMLWVFNDAEPTEAHVHLKFQHERIRGEWFHPSPTLLEYIKDSLINTYRIESNFGDIHIYEEFQYQLTIHLGDMAIMCRSNNTISLEGPRRITKVYNNTGG